jgi:type I restriction enzyme S subunit
MYAVFDVADGLDSDFFQHWLSSEEARQRIRLSAQGSVRETVGFNELGSILIPVPSIDRQKAISRTLNESHQEIALLRQLRQKYQDQKRGLMQKLLTGEWRVNEDSKKGAAA